MRNPVNSTHYSSLAARSMLFDQTTHAPDNRCDASIEEDRSQWRLQRAREILQAEVAAIGRLSENLNDTFSHAVEALLKCLGRTVVTGIGKAGIIGRKLSASLTSTGTPSHFLHPAEAVHGDLGCIGPSDVVVVLSYSGETEEVVRLLPTLRVNCRQIIAITASSSSTLGKQSHIVIELGRHDEACGMGLAPSTTTTSMLAVCDALALTVSDERGFTKEQFAQFHPAGNLGRQLMNVCEAMRPITECRVAADHLTVRQVMVQVSRPGRRTGAVMLVDDSNRLTGIFTDSDLARMLERCEDSKLDQPISQVMTKRFHTVSSDSRLPQATDLMAKLKISELPVIDVDGSPLGLIDLTDLVGMVTKAPQPENTKPYGQPQRLDSASWVRDDEEDSIASAPRIYPFPARKQSRQP